MRSKSKKDEQEITNLVLKAAKKALAETELLPDPPFSKAIKWPVNCTVGPGLEGAIACESEVGYVNGLKGMLIYRGYNIFDLCAYSTYEEVCYLLIHGNLPTEAELDEFKRKLILCRNIPNTLRLLVNFPITDMTPMSALRLGTNLMRQEFTSADFSIHDENKVKIISTDEDSIPMETVPRGESRAIYEFNNKHKAKNFKSFDRDSDAIAGLKSCYHLIGGVSTLAAAIARIQKGHFPIEPDSELSHAANLLYMMTGNRPSLAEERAMDISLILHADHGMNASTFAAMVVASTLSDVYFSIGSGIAALNGPLHGGANERVINMLKDIGSANNVKKWYKDSYAKKSKIMGFGHRVYKTYDPRGRILSPLAKHLASGRKESSELFKTARALEKEVVSTLGKTKKVFPNVDFYSGIVYNCLGISSEFFTTIFAVSRVAGWTARVLEYLAKNRIFRPRATYTGSFDKEYIPLSKRKK